MHHTNTVRRFIIVGASGPTSFYERVERNVCFLWPRSGNRAKITARGTQIRSRRSQVERESWGVVPDRWSSPIRK
jgi:hypothetical protein